MQRLLTERWHAPQRFASKNPLNLFARSINVVSLLPLACAGRLPTAEVKNQTAIEFKNTIKVS
ncbi:MAG: hypothetical protein DRN83_04105 [Hadesarchaea archaeon]|nr:MAG: hypothetical protein DRN83_04105 [Hadesarchaea archaeon]